MSEVLIDQEFFSAARRGLKTLSEEEFSSFKSAVENAVLDNGAYAGEAGDADIYMTAFGVQLLTLLKSAKNSEQTTSYLQSLGQGNGLDFLHVISLSRAWRFYTHDSLDVGSYSRIAEKIEYNRCVDGAWNQASKTHFSSVYGTFLALAGYQNLDQSVPEEAKIIAAMKGLKSSDGAFGTDQGAESGTTPGTSFAAIILSYMEEPVEFCTSWLQKQQHSDGGFLAVSKMPFSDLQSTVYALMALRLAAPEILKEVSPKAEEFLLSMKRSNGFAVHCKDEKITVENTFLGLAGLGLIHK
jgi:prenyltransferase beta subunit